MPAFEYRSLDHRGKVKRGTLEADSARQIRQQLRDKGWVPLEVSEAKDRQAGGGLSARLSATGKLKGGEQALITRQLATLLKSGLPVEQALSAVAKQAGQVRVEKIILAVRGKVLEGYSLAHALAEYPRAFRKCTAPPWPPGSRAATWSRCSSSSPTTWKPGTTPAAR